MSEPRIRPYAAADLGPLTAIYNHYVTGSIATFDLLPLTTAQFAEWVAAHTAGAGSALFVAEVDGEVVGYAGAGPFRPRAAYDRTVETTIYLAPGHLARGIGRALYARLFETLESRPLHRAIAVISLPNPASERLHARFGFRSVGRLTEVGRKFDRYWDVGLFERPLKP